MHQTKMVMDVKDDDDGKSRRLQAVRTKLLFIMRGLGNSG
jgi:hypothetical protein